MIAECAPSRLPEVEHARETSAPTNSTEAALLYTSGTTGKPKGCVLTNEYFLIFGDWYQGLGGLCALENGAERLITPLPLNHMNALACSFVAMLSTGGCIVQLDRFHPRSWWQSVRDSRATVLHYLGVMPAMLLNADPSPSDAFGDQIKFGFGAGVDPKHQATFENRFGFPLIEAWAMTETGSGACIIASQEPRHVGTRCFGRAPNDLEYRIVDEQKADVPSGEPGELLVRHAGDNPRFGFFKEYLKNPEATSEAWDGGWFHTGDVVRVADDGSFHFVDRRKNVIRRSGENIAAVEVEGVLFQHDAVENCAVAPVSDDVREQEVMACVVARDGFEDAEQLAIDIADFCREKLAYYKAPGYVAFVDELPTTASQKIRRGDVKTLCARLVEHNDAIDLRHLKRGSKRPGS
jgi:acyl-CoA synthetase (AMP-forming)/AMP-acid ligase II